MSVDWSQSRMHALNNSTSKPTYAFPKSTRFSGSLRPLYISHNADAIHFIMLPGIYKLAKEHQLVKGIKLVSGTGMDFLPHCSIRFDHHSKEIIKPTKVWS